MPDSGGGSSGLSAYVPIVAAGLNWLTGNKQAKNSQKQADAANAQQQQLIAQRQSVLNAIMPDITNASTLANTPAYSGIDDPNTQANINAQAEQYKDSDAQLSTNATAALVHALTQGGFGVRGDSGVGTGIGTIQSNAEQQDAKAQQSLQYQGGQNRYSDAKAAEDARFSRLSSLISTALNLGQTQQSGIGSQIQNNQNQANALGGGVAGFTSAVAKYLTTPKTNPTTPPIAGSTTGATPATTTNPLFAGTDFGNLSDPTANDAGNGLNTGWSGTSYDPTGGGIYGFT